MVEPEAVENESPKSQKGPLGESNPGPPAPEAGIMPLDQADTSSRESANFAYTNMSQLILIPCQNSKFRCRSLTNSVT